MYIDDLVGDILGEVSERWHLLSTSVGNNNNINLSNRLSMVVFMLYVIVSYTGCWPLVGWKMGNDMMCILEANDSDTGGVIDWGTRMGEFGVRYIQYPGAKYYSILSNLPHNFRKV